MNVNGNFKDNLMGKKKVIFIGCLNFCSRSDCRNPAHGFRRGKGFREEHLLRG